MDKEKITYENIADYKKHQRQTCTESVLFGTLDSHRDYSRDPFSGVERVFHDLCRRNQKNALDALMAATDPSYTPNQSGYNPHYIPVPYNSWPFGSPTKGVYQVFLGICCGKLQLKEAFQRITEYCATAINIYKPGLRKTVILLADKWSQEEFAPYEDKFYYLAITQNIDFRFFLISNYGSMRIPFVAADNKQLLEVPTLKELLKVGPISSDRNFEKMLNGYILTYKTSSNSWRREIVTWWFDLKKLNWKRVTELDYGTDVPSVKEGKIPLQVAAIADTALTRLGGMPKLSGEKVFDSDHTVHELDCFGENLVWSAQDRVSSNPQLAELEKVLRFLIRSLGERYSDFFISKEPEI